MPNVKRRRNVDGVAACRHYLARSVLSEFTRRMKLDLTIREFADDASLTDGIRDVFRTVFDFEWLLARVTSGRATPHDLGQVVRTPTVLQKAKAILAGRNSGRLTSDDATQP